MIVALALALKPTSSLLKSARSSDRRGIIRRDARPFPALSTVHPICHFGYWSFRPRAVSLSPVVVVTELSSSASEREETDIRRLIILIILTTKMRKGRREGAKGIGKSMQMIRKFLGTKKLLLYSNSITRIRREDVTKRTRI